MIQFVCILRLVGPPPCQDLLNLGFRWIRFDLRKQEQVILNWRTILIGHEKINPRRNLDIIYLCVMSGSQTLKGDDDDDMLGVQFRLFIFSQSQPDPGTRDSQPKNL